MLVTDLTRRTVLASAAASAAAFATFGDYGETDAFGLGGASAIAAHLAVTAAGDARLRLAALDATGRRGVFGLGLRP